MKRIVKDNLSTCFEHGFQNYGFSTTCISSKNYVITWGLFKHINKAEKYLHYIEQFRKRKKPTCLQ